MSQYLFLVIILQRCACIDKTLHISGFWIGYFTHCVLQYYIDMLIMGGLFIRYRGIVLVHFVLFWCVRQFQVSIIKLLSSSVRYLCYRTSNHNIGSPAGERREYMVLPSLSPTHLLRWHSNAVSILFISTDERLYSGVGLIATALIKESSHQLTAGH